MQIPRKLFWYLKFPSYIYTEIKYKIKYKMKDKIISKATEMFLKLGFKSVTMDDIATEMGISKKPFTSFLTTKSC